MNKVRDALHEFSSELRVAAYDMAIRAHENYRQIGASLMIGLIAFLVFVIARPDKVSFAAIGGLLFWIGGYWLMQFEWRKLFGRARR